MLHQWDMLLFHAVNAWCGNWALDRIVFYEQGNQLLEGGLILTCYWWFWFAQPDDRRNANRRNIVAALTGVFLALVVTRVLASILPFRVRPMYVAGIGYHAPSLQQPMNMEDWSSFPSDTAAFFIGLTYGIYRLSRRLGILLMLYAAIWICLPRLYLGIHYPSDLIAGAAIGVAVVAACMAVLGGKGGVADRLMRAVARQEKRRPGLFYAAAFALSFEMSMMFDDLRGLVRGVLHAAQVAGYAWMDEETALWVLLCILLVSASLAWMTRFTLRRRPPSRANNRDAVRVTAQPGRPAPPFERP